MRSTEDRLGAVKHIAHDVWLMNQASSLRDLRVGWTAWYVLARNVKMFLNDEDGPTDIRSKDFFAKNSPEVTKWDAARGARLKQAPPAYRKLKGDASQAVAHLSWKRVTHPEVQRPNPEVTQFLIALWRDFLDAVPEPFKEALASEWKRLKNLDVSAGATTSTPVLSSGMITGSLHP